MTRHRLAGALAALLLMGAALPAAAQTQQVWNAPYTKSVPLSVGTPVLPYFGSAPFTTPVRAIWISCTVSGNITLQLADGSQITMGALPVGIYVLPIQAVEVVSSSATATFSALG